MSTAGPCAAPVPAFTADPLTPAGFCAIRARDSICAALAQGIDDDSNRGQDGACCPTSATVSRPGALRSRKRKRARPTRSDDGCESVSYRTKTLESSTCFSQPSACDNSAQTSYKQCPARRKVTKRGLTAAQAIVASEKRRQARSKKKSSSKTCTVIVSGMLFPMTPVPQLPVRPAM